MVKRKIETKMDHRAKQLKRVQQRDEQQKTSALAVTKKLSDIFSSTPTPSSLILMELKQRAHRTVVKQSTVLFTSALLATKNYRQVLSTIQMEFYYVSLKDNDHWLRRISNAPAWKSYRDQALSTIQTELYWKF